MGEHREDFPVYLGKPQKNSFFNGSAIKLGGGAGGLKAVPLRGKNFFLNFFFRIHQWRKKYRYEERN